MPLELDSLERAVDSLKRALTVADKADGRSDEEREVLRAGVIQNFEFTYELCWKFIKRWLAANVSREAVEGVTRRQLFRLAAEQKLLDDVEQWMLFHGARNETVHTYDPQRAEEIYQVARTFLAAAGELLRRLRARND